MHWNEEMAGAQRKYSGRLWASAAVPLVDTRIAIEVLDHAIDKLGLMGANLPGSVGSDPRIDHERLEPFYDRVEELGVPLFLHPTDAVFEDLLEGYNGALHLSLGRVIEVSAAASRLSVRHHGATELKSSVAYGRRCPTSPRMDKNTKAALLPQPMSTYIKRMYTDTVSPHVPGMKFAIEYFGIDNVMYGTDYPCWDPATALKLLDEVGLSQADKEKLFYGNARRILGLRDPAPAKARPAAQEAALA
jgi:aminocarboxymuconate-semialdehyde decarboxylase